MSVLRIAVLDFPELRIDLDRHPETSVSIAHELGNHESGRPAVRVRAYSITVADGEHRFAYWNGPELSVGSEVTISHVEGTDGTETSPDETLRHRSEPVCSFCGESASDDRRLIASDGSAAQICHECVESFSVLARR